MYFSAGAVTARLAEEIANADRKDRDPDSECYILRCFLGIGIAI